MELIPPGSLVRVQAGGYDETNSAFALFFRACPRRSDVARARATASRGREILVATATRIFVTTIIC